MPGGGGSSYVGAIAVTEGGDIFAGLGTGLTVAAATEGADLGAFTGTCIVGTMADTEGHDALALAGSFLAAASMSATEGHDALAGAGSMVSTGSAAVTAGSDSLAASGVLITRASPALTEGGDLGALAGMFSAMGAVAATEGHDALAGGGAFATAASHGPDRGARRRALSAAWGSAGAGAVTESPDTAAMAGAFTASAVMPAVEGHDLGALAGSTMVAATMGATEGHDALVAFSSGLEYHIYENTGIGDPINYSSIIATTGLLEWTSGPLSFPGTWRFGVRAFSPVTGLEEQNLDCSITLILDASGNDITNRPKPPTALRAFATAGGGIRVEWAYNTINPLPVPTGFHVYIGTGGTPNYGAVKATVSFAASIGATFVANLASLTTGITYTIGVRAYNAVAEEPNTSTVNVVPSSAGPSAVVDLTGGAIV